MNVCSQIQPFSFIQVERQHRALRFCGVGCSSEPVLVQVLPFIWFTVSQVKPEHALTVQPQQEVKFCRHGMESLMRFFVIVVVVSEELVFMWVMAKGPEPVQVYVGTEFQRQAGHHHASGESSWSKALRVPEDSQTLEVLWVEEDRLGLAVKVLNGVQDP